MAIKRYVDKRGNVHFHVYVNDKSARRQKYVGSFDRRKDAEHAEQEMKRRMLLGEPLKPREQITFDALAKRWLAGLTSVRPATKTDYDKAIRRLKPFFGPMFVTAITRREIDAAIASLSARYSPSTTRKTITIMKSMLRVAVDWGYIDSLPTGATKLPLPKLRKRVWRPLTRQEVDRLLACAPDYWRPFYLFLLTTGTRRAEAWGVTLADLDLDAGVVHIRRQLVKRKLVDLKSDAAYRRIPLPRQTVEALIAFLTVRPENELNLLFPTPEGRPVDPPNYYARVHVKTRERAGLPHLRLHDLRHQYASTQIMLGRSVKYVQTTMGHANASVTLNTYSWLFPDEGDQAVADLDKWLSQEVAAAAWIGTAFTLDSTTCQPRQVSCRAGASRLDGGVA